MANVVVSPQEFTLVFFDAARIAEAAGEVADRVGLPAHIEIRIEVDEGSQLGRVRVTSLDPVTITVQGGAFEDNKAPRRLSTKAVADILGRMLFRVRDRLDPAFGDPPPDAELTLREATAWDTYSVGRCARLGYRPSKARRHYHFRNRHGFTDVADVTFERLWSATDLTWGDLRQACEETASVAS